MLHGCSPVDEAVRTGRPETLAVRMDVPATEVHDVTAFRFEDGLLREVVEAEPLQGQDAYGVSLENIPGRLYLLANSSALEAMTALLPEAVREDEFLALTATVEEMTGRGLLMTGVVLLNEDTPRMLPVSMRRSVARIDVAVLEAGVEVLSVEINGLYGEGYVMPQADIAVPKTAAQMRIVRDYADAPLRGGSDVAAYVPEQSGQGAVVGVTARLDGGLHRLRVSLPQVLERNNTYTVSVTGNGAGLSATVLSESWAQGPSSGSEHVPAAVVDTGNSVFDGGVRVNDRGDSVFVAYTGSVSFLALSAAPGSEVSVEGTTTEGAVEYADGGLRVTGDFRMPGSVTERVYVNVRQDGVQTGRIVVVFEASPVRLGGMLALDGDGICDFGRYVDGKLGTVTVPAGKTVSVEFEGEEDAWMRADLMREGDGVRIYRILGGWRPNDPTADGRMQEGLLVISDEEGGAREAYPVRRLNWGLPVARIGDTWWTLFNLRGNARSFEDQITCAEIPVAADALMDMLLALPGDSLLGLMGDQYQAGNPDGLRLSHDGSLYYYEGMKSSGGDFGLLDPAVMAPDGYRIPSYEDFAFLAASDDYNLGGTGTRTFTNRVGKQITVTIAERQAEFLGHDYGTVAFYEFSSDGGTWVLYGPGHQWNTTAGNVARMNILLATHGAAGRSWGLEGYASSDRPGQNWLKYVAHNNTKTRTIRCVKTPVEYIY